MDTRVFVCDQKIEKLSEKQKTEWKKCASGTLLPTRCLVQVVILHTTVRLNIYGIIKKEVAGARKTSCGSTNSCSTKILNYPRW